MLGTVGALYNSIIIALLRACDRSIRISTLQRAALIGGSIGLMAWFAPAMVGGGDNLTQRALRRILILCRYTDWSTEQGSIRRQMLHLALIYLLSRIFFGSIFCFGNLELLWPSKSRPAKAGVVEPRTGGSPEITSAAIASGYLVDRDVG